MSTDNRYHQAPPVPSNYPRLAALTSAEIDKAIRLGYVVDGNRPSPAPSWRDFDFGGVLRLGETCLIDDSRDAGMENWLNRMFLIWFCYIVENFFTIRHPLSAIEDIIGTFEGGPDGFDFSDEDGWYLATAYAGRGAEDCTDGPRAHAQRERELQRLSPYYERAVRMLTEWTPVSEN